LEQLPIPEVDFSNVVTSLLASMFSSVTISKAQVTS
jgi:hypothetical protein